MNRQDLLHQRDILTYKLATTPQFIPSPQNNTEIPMAPRCINNPTYDQLLTRLEQVYVQLKLTEPE